MRDAAARRERLNFLIRENYARPRRQQLLDLLHEAGLGNDDFALVVPPDSDRLWRAMLEGYRALCKSGELWSSGPQDLNAALTLLADLATDTDGPWALMLLTDESIGALEFATFPPTTVFLTLCAFDREALWVTRNNSFFALFDLRWEGNYDPATVICEIETSVNMVLAKHA
ncbi:MAG: hypothetical protein Q4C87_10810 [Actinomycetaceae bacterium]|nr:hypothetical protein [Actinomycetaceae bacterium]